MNLRTSNMAVTNRGLLKWFASKNAVWSALKMIPFLVLYVYVLATMNAHFWSLPTFFLGILGWSLFEYIVHRWIYHIPIRNLKLRWFLDAFHAHHHKNLEDHGVLNAGFLLSYPITLIILGSVYLLSGNFVLTAAFGLGMTIHYIFYEFVHYLIHYKYWSSGYMHFIQKYHLFHHYVDWKKNFGNTTAIWDIFLNTYDKKYKCFSATDEMKRSFIKPPQSLKS